MDILLSAITGQRLQSLTSPQPATDTLGGKLQSTQPVRIQYAKPGPTGTAYVLCASPGSTIKFGFKQLSHYSDATFDVYTDGFTAPTDPTAADSYYVGTLNIDSTALRLLFPVATDGTSLGFVPLMGEVLSGGLPSADIPFQAQNNIIKGTESPAVSVPGPSGYPSADAVNAFLAPYRITAAAITTAAGGGSSATILLPAGTIRAFCDEPLPCNLVVQVPSGATVAAGETLELLVGFNNGHSVSWLATDGTVDGFGYGDGPVLALAASITASNARLRVLLDASLSDWTSLREVFPLPVLLGLYTLSTLPGAVLYPYATTTVSNPAAGKSYLVTSAGSHWRYQDQSIAV